MARTSFPTARPVGRKVPFATYFRTNYWLYLFLVPAVVAVLIFNYIPMWGVIMAFQDVDPLKGVLGSRFVGLANFRSVLSTPDMLRILRNTLAISLLGFAFGFPLPIVLAILISELRSTRFKRFVQTTSYLPHFISWVIVAGLAFEMFNSENGAVNNLLVALGMPKVEFLTTGKLFWPFSVGVAIWKECGWASIIYLAVITNIDPEYYEAAIIDGAGRLQRIVHITLPLMMPTVAMLLILNAGALLSGAGISPGFEGVFNLMNPMVANYAETLDYWVYREGIVRAQFAFGATVGLGLAVINFGLVYLANKAANKIADMGIL